MPGFFAHRHRSGARAAKPPWQDRYVRSPVYVAAAFCIVLGISCTAIAVWRLDDGDTSGRLIAAPWPCCLADR